MTRIVIVAAFLLFGCEPPPPRIDPPPPPPTQLQILSQKDETEVIFEEEKRDCNYVYWKIIKVKHKNKIHTYLHSIRGDHQTMTHISTDEIEPDNR